jgi:diguanylate cyclase (GGDEF)-like protein
VRPSAFKPWHYLPPVVISALQINGKPLPAAGVKRLTLPPGSRDFSVEFAALDYSAPGSLHYAYRLDGYESHWREVSPERRIAAFTNLDPGHYTLQVKATNREDEWSPHQLALSVDVEPAFYETLWFRALMIVPFLLALYGIYAVRIRRLDARARHLESLVRERTTSLARANAELALLARTDTLTGLSNRRAFLEATTSEVERMQRYGRPFSIVLGDIDLFKNINDIHGHDAGDTVLKTVASVLGDSIRSQDTLARWGGEEIIILLPETELASACTVAEKCRRALEAVETRLGEAKLRITMTFGVSQIHPGESIDDCIRRADKALYAGKQAGRNRVVPNAGTA